MTKACELFNSVTYSSSKNLFLLCDMFQFEEVHLLHSVTYFSLKGDIILFGSMT